MSNHTNEEGDMGKLIATYLVRVTLREPDVDPSDTVALERIAALDPPTLDELGLAIENMLLNSLQGSAIVNATAERVDA